MDFSIFITLCLVLLVLSFNSYVSGQRTSRYFDYVPNSSCFIDDDCLSGKCEKNENWFCQLLSKSLLLPTKIHSISKYKVAVI